MPIITNYPITLDVHEVLSQVSISVPQDKARRISATLTENGSPLYLPDGCRAVFSATKADGTTVNNDCIIEHNTIIRYDFTEQTTAAVGKVECCFKVYGLEGEYLYGPIFTLVVYENKAGDVTFSEDEKNFLDRIFAAEESRISAELLRDDAERARGVAETSRVAAEQERVTAENARKAALVDNLTTDDPGKYLSARMGKKLNEDKVPTTRTVNKKPLSADIELTASDVGAAPAGFGLGETQGRTIVDLNTITTIGFYQTVGDSTKNAPDRYMEYSALLVQRRANHVYQTLYCADGYQSTEMAMRYSADAGATWGEWEWVNPPMEVGVDYRTTERWMGKPVYTRLIDFEALPNNSEKSATFYMDYKYTIVSIDGVVRGEGLDEYGMVKEFDIHACPYVKEVASLQLNNKITIKTNGDATKYNAKIVLKYTK